MRYLVKYDVLCTRGNIVTKSEVVEAKDKSEARQLVQYNLISHTDIRLSDIHGWSITGIKGYNEADWLKSYDVSFVYIDGSYPELYYYEVEAPSREDAIWITLNKYEPIEIREVLERR